METDLRIIKTRIAFLALAIQEEQAQGMLCPQTMAVLKKISDEVV